MKKLNPHLLFFILCFINSAVWAAEWLSFPVPIAKNSLPRPSSLYLGLKVEKIGENYVDFKNGSSGEKEDELLIKTMDSILSKDVKGFEQVAQGVQFKSENDITKYLNDYHNLYDGFSNMKVLYKVKLHRGFGYIWSADVNGGKIANAHFYEENEKRQFKYKHFESLSDIELIIKDSLAKSFYLPEEFRLKNEVDKEFRLELDDENGNPLGAYLEFDGHYQKFNIVSDEPESKLAYVKAIFEFYKDRHEELEEEKLIDFFSFLTKKSQKRLGGMPNAEDFDNVLKFVKNRLMPKEIIFIVKAEPFYIVVGTNFPGDFVSAIDNKNINRARDMANVPVFYSYLIKENGVFKFVNFRYTGLLDKVLRNNKFLMKKMVAPVVLETGESDKISINSN